MNPKCHICYTNSFFLLNKDDFDLYECPNCRLVFVWPQPSSEFLNKLYSFESGYQSNRTENLSNVKEISRATKVLNFFEKFNPKGYILDVGCSGGYFMYWAKKEVSKHSE